MGQLNEINMLTIYYLVHFVYAYWFIGLFTEKLNAIQYILPLLVKGETNSEAGNRLYQTGGRNVKIAIKRRRTFIVKNN